MELQIDFDKNQAIFVPGEVVSGRIVLTKKSDVKAKFLEICIHGCAETNWTVHEKIHYRNSEGNYSHRIEGIKYSALVNYLKGESIVWKATDQVKKLPAGVSIFPFSFQLPFECPPSFNGCHGKIEYKIDVKLDRPWNFNVRSHRCFHVISITNFERQIAAALTAHSSTMSTNVGLLFTRHKKIEATATIPRIAYRVGESIPIRVIVSNQSQKRVEIIKAVLIQTSKYFGRRGVVQSIGHFEHCQPHVSNESRCDSQDVAKAKKEFHAIPYQQTTVDLILPIPILPSTFSCPIISVDYQLSIKINNVANSLLSQTFLTINFPIYIGSAAASTPSQPTFVPQSNASATTIASAPPLEETSTTLAHDPPPSYNNVFGSGDQKYEATSSAPPGYYDYSKNQEGPLPSKSVFK